MFEFDGLIDYLLKHDICAADVLIEQADKNELLSSAIRTDETWRKSVKIIDDIVHEALIDTETNHRNAPGPGYAKELLATFGSTDPGNSNAVSLSDLLVFLKRVRKIYKDGLRNGFTGNDLDICRTRLDRIFDSMEIGLLEEWTSTFGPGSRWIADRTIAIEHRYLTVFRDLPEPLAILDVDGTIGAVNNSYFTTFLDGKIPAETFSAGPDHIDLPASIVDPIMAFLKGPDEQSEFTAEMSSCMGNRRFTICAKRMVDGIGNDLGTVLMFNDITDLEKTMRDLVLANEKIRLLGEMTRHDTLNLLTVINGNLQLMEMKAPDASLTKYIRTSVEATNDIHRLMEASRDYQRMGTKEAAWVNLAKAVRDGAEKVGGMDKELVMEIDEDREVFADPLFERIFINLFFNTMKHAETAKTVRVSENVGIDGSLTILYEDDGPGIPLERKTSLFDEKLGRRTGHGLHFTRRLLQITDMDIEEVGEFGKGVRFALTVPNHGHRKVSTAEIIKY